MVSVGSRCEDFECSMCISVNIILVASASTVASREVVTGILCEDSDYIGLDGISP